MCYVNGLCGKWRACSAAGSTYSITDPLLKPKKRNPNSDLAATNFFTTGSFELEKGKKQNSDKSILPTTLFLQIGCSWLPVAKTMIAATCSPFIHANETRSPLVDEESHPG